MDQDGNHQVAGKVSLNEVDYHWIRFGANTKDGDFRFYGNPITRGHHIPKIKTFGQACQELEVE
ncbi:hypothetical protein [Streptococcus penaeicida]|uniref:hypothetical protein n=1 Tax=Streptococcus penaeicida TaxID=1765960 RepID=UPI001FEC2E96|nr:hypothetical protein [Streptococcus penaeicida]